MSVGDHGEELFDHGYLGHGVDITHEQNETFLKLVNGTIEAPKDPVGLCDIGRVLYNALQLDPAGRVRAEVYGASNEAMAGVTRALLAESQ